MIVPLCCWTDDSSVSTVVVVVLEDVELFADVLPYILAKNSDGDIGTFLLLALDCWDD